MLGPPLAETEMASRSTDGWWTAVTTGHGTIVPDGAVDLMWSPGHTPWIAGPDTRPRNVSLTAGSRVVGVRLKHGVAPHVLGDSVVSALDQAVSLDAVWARSEVAVLIGGLERLTEPARWGPLISQTIEMHLPLGFTPDPFVADAVQRIRRGEAISGSGLSDRQLRRRFTEAIGYGPAFYRRITRLDRFTDLVSDAPHRSNAELAAAAGYFDEAHLWRDATALTDSTPTDLRARYVA